MKFRHYFLFVLLLAASLICFWALAHIILGVPFPFFHFDTIIFFEGMVECVAFGLFWIALIASNLSNGEGESSANNMLAAMSLVALFGRR
ncbi:hypothetical protein [Maritalea mediterranea]|uniref:DUF1345 domain-containing protein n=1 Tax=Maritalea mediterranea TaxID=2909667 RepID=A0ABS9EA32_9HYPH|nr:hypothetical protein [Maritalea mediterranea]MCF4099747.1 hypothetical protein [Maritalea mediterranea]